jgi:hypothetical protein
MATEKTLLNDLSIHPKDYAETWRETSLPDLVAIAEFKKNRK